MQLSEQLQSDKTDTLDEEGTTATFEFPRGRFNLILGSVFIYLPDHAFACTNTIHDYYQLTLTDDDAGDNNSSGITVTHSIQKEKSNHCSASGQTGLLDTLFSAMLGARFECCM